MTMQTSSGSWNIRISITVELDGPNTSADCLVLLELTQQTLAATKSPLLASTRPPVLLVSSWTFHPDMSQEGHIGLYPHDIAQQE
jgi:hypothetical protein